MNIDSIKNGIVIDHISAGKSMDLYHLLHLEELECSVAIIKNVQSKKMGKKDIIKIDSDFDLNLDILGYIDPEVTLNIIKNGKRTEKFHPTLPKILKNVVSCKNPRCITSEEPGAEQIFKLTDKEKRIYRCIYCDTAFNNKI